MSDEDKKPVACPACGRPPIGKKDYEATQEAWRLLREARTLLGRASNLLYPVLPGASGRVEGADDILRGLAKDLRPRGPRQAKVRH